MATTEERMKILMMIEQGKVSAEEGAKLLAALASANRPLGGLSASGAKWLRVRVTDTDSGKARVNVRLPVGLIKAGVKMGAKFSPEIEGLDIDQLMTFINSGELGQIVDVFDEDGGEHVEVFIE